MASEMKEEFKKRGGGNEASILGISTSENPRVDTTVGQEFLPPQKTSGKKDHNSPGTRVKIQQNKFFLILLFHFLPFLLVVHCKTTGRILKR